MEDERQFLSKIAACSAGVTFLPGDVAGTIKLAIYFLYYRPVISEEEIEQRWEDFLNAMNDVRTLLSD